MLLAWEEKEKDGVPVVGVAKAEGDRVGADEGGVLQLTLIAAVVTPSPVGRVEGAKEGVGCNPAARVLALETVAEPSAELNVATVVPIRAGGDAIALLAL